MRYQEIVGLVKKTAANLPDAEQAEVLGRIGATPPSAKEVGAQVTAFLQQAQSPLYRMLSQDVVGATVGLAQFQRGIRSDFQTLDRNTLDQLDEAMRSGKGLEALDAQTRGLVRSRLDDRAYEKLEIVTSVGADGPALYARMLDLEEALYLGAPASEVQAIVRSAGAMPGGGLLSSELKYRLVNEAYGLGNGYSTGDPNADFAASAFGVLDSAGATTLTDLEAKLSASVGKPLLAEAQSWTPGWGNKATVEAGIIAGPTRRDPESGLWVPLEGGQKGYLTLNGQEPLAQGVGGAKEWGETESRGTYRLSRSTFASLQLGKVDGPAGSWYADRLSIGDDARTRFEERYATLAPRLAPWGREA